MTRVYCDEHRRPLVESGICLHDTAAGLVAWHRPDIVDTFTVDDRPAGPNRWEVAPAPSTLPYWSAGSWEVAS